MANALIRRSRLLRRAVPCLFVCILLGGCASHGRAAFQTHERIPAPSGSEVLEGSVGTPPLDLVALEQDIQDIINAVRQEHGLPSLAWNEKLAYVARTHSRDMAEHHFFDHVNQRGEMASERGQQAGFACKRQVQGVLYEGIGENLFYTYRYDAYRIVREKDRVQRKYDWKSLHDLARETVDGWLNSPPHRANLLSRVYHTQGIGVALTAEQQLYVTQNLC